MSYRFMRVLVMFDLPILTSEQKREYREFRRFLIKSGFLMLQESVYCKLVLNKTTADTVLSNIEKNKPPEGIVQVLVITEKQFSNMKLIVGNLKKDIIDTDERIVII
ncbi:CRISPR-associated endonuclease Cas2 [Peptoniphilus sp. oral taxon 386]|uniref:CRISPR-associated endonuclease Cas2 n=1 Tax=Peptoniphilus sp. oral taxon 386 TaxID=652713 RepID=UPI0020D25595|nr:CRISPR-associated endonuclease Cas2 [Peptoniphilus sp. oral taxon 386]